MHGLLGVNVVLSKHETCHIDTKLPNVVHASCKVHEARARLKIAKHGANHASEMKDIASLVRRSSHKYGLGSAPLTFVDAPHAGFVTAALSHKFRGRAHPQQHISRLSRLTFC
mmetsp:Transcript_1968/g.4965  ORF Transcript_1968/g.4965 Transcript_1968/m.4965 type:complete len:113 (+) Transcript_1968:116-454(+)